MDMMNFYEFSEMLDETQFDTPDMRAERMKAIQARLAQQDTNTSDVSKDRADWLAKNRDIVVGNERGTNAYDANTDRRGLVRLQDRKSKPGGGPGIDTTNYGKGAANIDHIPVESPIERQLQQDPLAASIYSSLEDLKGIYASPDQLVQKVIALGLPNGQDPAIIQGSLAELWRISPQNFQKLPSGQIRVLPVRTQKFEPEAEKVFSKPKPMIQANKPNVAAPKPDANAMADAVKNIKELKIQMDIGNQDSAHTQILAHRTAHQLAAIVTNGGYGEEAQQWANRTLAKMAKLFPHLGKSSIQS